MKKNKIHSLDELLNKAKYDPDWFWEKASSDLGIFWYEKFHTVCSTDNGKQWSRWFVGGKTNIYSSCIEKNLQIHPEKIAYIFLAEDGSEKKITYYELDKISSKIANGLKSMGVNKGDVVAIYMPMIAEAIFIILACAKIGAIHTVIFSGFSSDSLKLRLQDCKAKILFVTDGFIRRGKPISQKNIVEKAIEETMIEKTVIVPYKGIDNFQHRPGFVNYLNLIENMSNLCKTEVLDSESPLFILYTSGTTGKPKGVIHVHGGYSIFAAHQAAYLIDLKEHDMLFWPADIGWITGLTWNVYGLMEIGATAVIYAGSIDWPSDDRIWKIIEQYKVTIFGISPTAIRMLKTKTTTPSISYDLKSIRIITTTGEPIDKDTWWWIFDKIGNKKIPIMNLSGGTEVGGAFLSVLPGMKIKPCTVGVPCPGIDADVFDEQGSAVRSKKGFLIIKNPWPSITRGLLNDDARYLDAYWSKFDGVWFHGDLASVDEDGLWYLHGRVDDVINISGHRLSTAEIEECIASYPGVIEAAAISIPDEITGESVVVFAVVKKGISSKQIEDELKEHVTEKIGKLAKPKIVKILSDLPKTRTGKTMRRLLKAKFMESPLGDVSSIENPQILNEI